MSIDAAQTGAECSHGYEKLEMLFKCYVLIWSRMNVDANSNAVVMKLVCSGLTKGKRDGCSEVV